MRTVSVLVVCLSFLGVIGVGSAWAGYYEYLCATEDSEKFATDCLSWPHVGWKCADDTVVDKFSKCAKHDGVVRKFISICGDGIGDPGEQCDKGSENSDSLANGCRTDCRTAYCGDTIKDSGEACDSNDNKETPNSCRPDCTLPFCGDGIHDNGAYQSSVFNEECDDGNANNLDGCKTDCSACLQLTGNVEVIADTKLCGQSFTAPDYGDEGVIIVKYPGVTVDCDGATLQGSGIGVGIFVKMSNNVKIKNCTVSGYATGIKAVNSQNLSIESVSSFSGNTKAVELVNSTRVMAMAASAITGNMPGGGASTNITNQLPPADEKPKRLQTSKEKGASGLTVANSKGKAPKFQASKSAPIIVYPRNQQMFSAPASFVAKVADNSREKLVYKVKNVAAKGIVLQSKNGQFKDIPAGAYCVEVARKSSPDSPGECVMFTVLARQGKPGLAKSVPSRLDPAGSGAAKPFNTLPATVTARPAKAAPPALTPLLATAKSVASLSPKGTIKKEGKLVFLLLNVAASRVEVYAGKRRLHLFPGAERYEISKFVPMAQRGELIFHYFTDRGVKTVEKLRVR